MKRFVTVLALMIAAAFCAIFAGCNVRDLNNAVSSALELTTLAEPAGLRIDDGKLEWNPVEFASKYTVSVDGKEYYTTDTSYSIAALPNGEHTFKVKANGDGVSYKTSNFSAEYTATLLDGNKTETGYYSQFDDLTKQESFLGYGFDVIESSTFSDKEVKLDYSIFNPEDLMKQRLLKVDSKNSVVREMQSADLDEFMRQWNVDANVDVSWGTKSIGGSVGVAAQYSGGSSTAKSKYYHAISIVNQKYYIVMQSDMETYRGMLSKGFINDLYSDLTPAELFKRYGTHFITSAVMGGRINAYYLYTSEQEVEFHDVSAKVSTQVRYLAGKTDVSVEGGYQQFAESQGIKVTNDLEVLGGGDFGMLSDEHIAANYLAWEKSLENRLSLIGIRGTSSLCPIWDLIDATRDSEAKYTWTDVQGETQTGTRAQQLQGYFWKYGVDNYNELMQTAGKIVPPESIENIRINGLDKNAEGEYEAYAGASNPISFNVLPDKATGYTKTASIVEINPYVEINNKNGELSLEVLPNAPKDTVVTVKVGAGNKLETITVRIVHRYNVTFMLNGGTMDYDTIPYQDLLAGSRISPPNPPTKEGFKFGGWYTDPNFDEESLYRFGEQTIRDDITLYARWWDGTEEGIEIQVSFVSNGGTEVASQTVVVGNLIKEPEAPSKDGFTFEGWYTDEACTQPFNFMNTVVAEDVTLYAKWKNATMYYNPATQTLSLNLQAYQEYGEVDSKDFSNYEDGILTIKPKTVDGQEIRKIYILGSYKGEKEGVPIETLISNVSIYFSYGNWSDNTIQLVLENVGLKQNTEKPILDFSEVTSSSIKITLVGANYLEGGENKGETQPIVFAPDRNLSIMGEGDLTVTGASGIGGQTEGENGVDGVAAISVNTLTIDVVGSITFIGGNGGDGASATSKGGHGGDGGNGAVALKVTSMTANAVCEVELTSGNGGKGGDGAKGSDGDNGGNFGGNGGNGGNGGKGGDVYAFDKSVIEPDVDEANIHFGKGTLGEGGSGGDGGNGGNGLLIGGNKGSAGKAGDNGYYILKVTSVPREEPATITHNGYYGAYGKDKEGNKLQDEIDLSGYRDLFVEKNEFRFDITLDMKEVYDGYQEVHLYNSNTLFAGAEEELSQEELAKGGYVTGRDDLEYGNGQCKNRGTNSLTLTTTGEKLQGTLYLRYDAHGEDADDWMLYGVEIVVYYRPVSQS